MMKTAFIVMIVFLCNLFAIVAFVPNTLVNKTAEAEYNLTASTVSPEVADRLFGDARLFFDKHLVDTGIIQASFDTFIPTEEQRRASAGMEDMNETMFEIAHERIVVFWTLVYCGIERMMAFAMWMPYFFIFFVASMFDGIVSRQIKLITFAMFSAPKFGMAANILLLLLFFPLFYFFFPFQITPMVVPVWMIATSIAVWVMAANMQRV